MRQDKPGTEVSGFLCAKEKSRLLRVGSRRGGGGAAVRCGWIARRAPCGVACLWGSGQRGGRGRIRTMCRLASFSRLRQFGGVSSGLPRSISSWRFLLLGEVLQGIVYPSLRVKVNMFMLGVLCQDPHPNLLPWGEGVAQKSRLSCEGAAGIVT